MAAHDGGHIRQVPLYIQSNQQIQLCFIYIIYSQGTVIDNITAILYVSVKCVQCNQTKNITINSVPYQRCDIYIVLGGFNYSLPILVQVSIM